ncbi:hypothetical protein [Arcobacter sp. LA11]|uniref:hypothetical protein n=1 Tax=Arcobacter sp. LA11 TaxID=1898176 RepID=UPI000934D0DD|nr:hypothetical protein [Arcobacter sp. LA11]
MLEKIGETLDNIDVFRLSDTIAVDDDGIIYKIDKDELCDSIYCVADFENRTSLDDIKSHIINPYKLIVGEHRVDIVSNKIDGAHFKYEDDESNDYVSINFKNNEIKLYDNGDIEDNITNKEFKSHIIAIEKAYHYEVDEYEDFNSLRF